MLAFIKKHKEIIMIIAAGAAIGVMGVCLACLGNPRNSGICVSCFMENLAGSLGLHGNARMQYIRPELMGFVLGGTAAAFAAKEFKAEGGSSPIIRFLGGMLLIIGCSIFLGCPIKMALRLTNGDFTALAGVGGLVFGVWAGYQFLRRGFHLGDSAPMPLVNGLVIPLIMLGLLVAAVFQPGFLHFSVTGPGSQRASRAVAMGSGLLIGVLAQRSRFCVTGSIGNFIVAGDRKMLTGLVSMLVFALLVSLYKGFFFPGFEGQPGSHMAYGWSFLGMALVGIVSVMIGGCPFRQLILSSQGSTDAGAAVLGMIAGGAVVQSWGITSSNFGPTIAGEVATLMGLGLVLVLGIFMRARD
ncbi:MAG TPA: YedE family putative selenium transporter [Nitrospirota bacterium]|nr:YedE family putative selenium transporter [Nitrospirota bacterium]